VQWRPLFREPKNKNKNMSLQSSLSTEIDLLDDYDEEKAAK
jgi:hypothetical protein